jgi:DNA-binding LacI/PurR family transcriptional regulator
VPSGMAVVGFDDIKLSTEMNPRLTTVRQPIRDMGSIGAEYLMSQGEQSENGPFQKRLPVELVVRESSVLGGNK